MFLRKSRRLRGSLGCECT